MKLSVLISFSGEGGVERMICNLVAEFVRQGHHVDLVLIKARSAHLSRLPPSVNIVKLGTTHTALSLWPLIRYLRRARPEAMLVAKHRAIVVATLARLLSGVPVRIVGRLGTNLSGALEGKSRLRAWFWHQQMRWIYPKVDRIIAVSQGVADDVRQITGLGTDRLEVVRNPVIVPELYELAQAPLDHPWLASGQPPLILGAGRFTPQKDFLTLIRAFALLRRQRPCRLMLLGKGELQGQYQALAEELGVAQDIAFPGFADNPYAYMNRAALFVLSSAWEGSPNVLSEALALGTPVVSTDCPSGPLEILQHGKYGPLVPVGDVQAMAQAMARTLAKPAEREFLRLAMAEYTVSNSARRYLQALGVAPHK